MASETDIRRHKTFSALRPSGEEEEDGDGDEHALSTSSALAAAAPEDFPPLSQQESHRSEPPERASYHAPEPSTNEAEQRNNKFRRFSILRYRNASDSQLSLRAKQQAETPPPVPRRVFLSTILLS
jgi:hypothetical protein